MSTAINQRKKYVKNYRSQYDKNCPFSTLRKTGKGKTSIEACTAGFVAAVVLKSVEFLEKAVNCIPKSVILEHDYKACDSYVKKLEDAISLVSIRFYRMYTRRMTLKKFFFYLHQQVKKDKPEKFHCTVGVLSRFSFIANEAKNDIMKCGALVSFHPVYCLGRIQKRIDQDYKNSYRQLERCIARTDVLPKNNAHSRN